jgi:hypothetical protein
MRGGHGAEATARRVPPPRNAHGASNLIIRRAEQAGAAVST